MPVGLLVGGSLLIAAWALWVRRNSFGCRWEGAPTLVVGSAAATAYLTSGHASEYLGPFLHNITGLWNQEDLLGHCTCILCLATAVYMFLVRFGDDGTVQAIYTHWVSYPLTAIVPVLIALYLLGRGSRVYNRYFENIEPGSFLALYWVALIGTCIYLLIRAGQVLLMLRQTDGGDLVSNLYFAAIVLTGIALALAGGHALLPISFFAPMNVVAALATVAWVLAPALSWIRRTHLAIVHPDNLRVRGDGGEASLGHAA